MKEGFSYIGITPCGCVVNAIVDSPEYQSEVAKALPKWIMSGLTIERVTHQQVRERYSPCQHAALQLELNAPANKRDNNDPQRSSLQHDIESSSVEKQSGD